MRGRVPPTAPRAIWQNLGFSTMKMDETLPVLKQVRALCPSMSAEEKRLFFAFTLGTVAGELVMLGVVLYLFATHALS